jgi:hypothetical protein
MALTPIGPFCPFRSSASQAQDWHMDELHEDFKTKTEDIEKISLELQMGKDVDKDVLLRAADYMERNLDKWETSMARMKLSGDFQTIEYLKLAQAQIMDSTRLIPEDVVSLMRWQSACMRAMALNIPPPMPPADFDLQRLIEQAESGTPPPSLSALSKSIYITSNPVLESAFSKSDIVKAEYLTLCDDHKRLVELGTQYSAFDPTGKAAYLDQIDKIEERWDVLFTRFSLMGSLNPEFSEQCLAFLKTMNLDETDYRRLLKKAHDLMREDAEQEHRSSRF